MSAFEQMTDAEHETFGDVRGEDGRWTPGPQSENGNREMVGDDWLAGAPMNPLAVAPEPLPSLPGFPFLHAGAGAVIVGPTGKGRSALIEACLYDAARARLRCIYLGSEITQPEFDARAALLADVRGDEVDESLLEDLANVRYLHLAATIAQAWGDPEAWVDGVAGRYEVVAIDPLSRVANALDLDFDKANLDFTGFYNRLIQPLVSRGVTVAMVDNVGHAQEAKRRAKGVSAKGDLVDLSFSCGANANPVGLSIKADKVRSVRSSHEPGDEWLFVKDTQRVERRESTGTFVPFKPTNIMEKISRALEDAPGLSKTSVRKTVGGNHDHVDLALELLIGGEYVDVRQVGQTHGHHTLKPYREAQDA